MKAVLLAAIFLVLAAPAAALATSVDGLILATEAETEGDEAPSTTTMSEGGIAPAEMAPPGEDAEQEDQWTARFLAPTVAILGALGVVAAFLLYGVRLRGRYRVVE